MTIANAQSSPKPTYKASKHRKSVQPPDCPATAQIPNYSSPDQQFSLPDLSDMGYTAEQRAYAVKHRLCLGTISVATSREYGLSGKEFSGPITPEERNEIADFLTEFLRRRSERLKQEKDKP